jgi:recombination protein RecT
MSTTKQMTVSKADMIDNVQNRIAQLQEGGFKLPSNYSPENALQSAWLMLHDVQTRDKKPALEACSKNSIAMALFKMVQLGLNPAKTQCYFIPYGNDLTMVTSYFGQVLIAKRAGLKDVKAEVIREGEEFEFKTEQDGRKVLITHGQSFKTLGNKILGAYCIITYADGVQDMDLMTIDDIKQSWQQGATKGDSPAHKNFEGEMAKRTVTNRAIKMFVNSSDDSVLMDDDAPRISPTEAYVEHTIAENANKKEITMDVDAEEVKDEEAENQKLYEEAMAAEGQSQMTGPGF